MSRAFIVICDRNPDPALLTHPQMERALAFSRGVAELMARLLPNYAVFTGGRTETLSPVSAAWGTAQAVERQCVTSTTFLFEEAGTRLSDRIANSLYRLRDESDAIETYYVVCDRRPGMMLKAGILGKTQIDATSKIVTIGRPRHLPEWLTAPFRSNGSPTT